MATLLPIADGPELRRHARAIARRHRAALAGVVALHGFAAAAGLVAPALLGRLVQSIEEGTTGAYVDKLVAVLAGFILLQTALTWGARRASFVLSERTTQFIAKRMQDVELASSDPGTSMAASAPIVKKRIEPPRWLGLAFLSAGIVLTVHGLSLKKQA